MKTLDEVIKAYEYCINNNYRDCRGCPYGCEDGDSGCTNAEEKNDVLHYLKKLKRIEERMERIALGNLENTLSKMDNPPLTWDELKAMEGKPVWVEHKYYKKWLIVKEVYEETIVLDGNGFYTQYFSDDNEKETRWQAYRKERS